VLYWYAMIRCISKTRRAVLAAMIATVQLLSVEWAATVHAQLEAANSQVAIEYGHTSECAYVHDGALCPACTASTLVAPTCEAPVKFSFGPTKRILSQRIKTIARSPIIAKANSVRAPPPMPMNW